MLLRDIIAVYCENHTEHTSRLCGLDAEFLHVEAGCTYSKELLLLFQAVYINEMRSEVGSKLILVLNFGAAMLALVPAT